MAHPEIRAQVNWLPFFLDASLPREGEPFADFLRAKFGSQAQVNAMLGRVADAARDDPVEFAFDRIRVRPNTLLAHRLCYRMQSLGGHPDQIRAFTRALFVAYFQEGRDIGHPETLADIAAAHGARREDILSYLEGEGDVAAVLKMEKQIHQQGISGVPFFILNRRLTVSGAQSSAVLGASILQAVAA